MRAIMKRVVGTLPAVAIVVGFVIDTAHAQQIVLPDPAALDIEEPRPDNVNPVKVVYTKEYFDLGKPVSAGDWRLPGVEPSGPIPPGFPHFDPGNPCLSFSFGATDEVWDAIGDLQLTLAVLCKQLAPNPDPVEIGGPIDDIPENK